MSAICNSFADLQRHFVQVEKFVSTLETPLVRNKKFSDNELKPIRTFSEALAKTPPILHNPQIASIQRKWCRVCSELVADPPRFSPLCLDRVHNIGIKVRRVPEPTKDVAEKTAAEEVLQLLDSSIVQENLKQLLSPEAKSQLTSCPNAIKRAKKLVRRLTNGHYGEHLKQKVFDSLKNPLHLHTQFLRLLLIDLLLQGKDPLRKVEWFSSSSAYVAEKTAGDIARIKDEIAKLGPALKARAALDNSDFAKFAISHKPCFAAQIEDCIARVVNSSSYNRIMHQRTLEHMGPFFQPKNSELGVIAGTLIQTDPTRAFNIACLMIGKERVKIVCHVLKAIIDSKRLLLACTLLESLLPNEIGLYCQCMEFFAPKLVELDQFNFAMQYMRQLAEHPCYIAIAKSVIVQIAKKGVTDSNQSQIISVITEARTLEQQAELLETCFTQFLFLPRSDASFEVRFAACEALLKKFDDGQLRQLGLSSLHFIPLHQSLTMMPHDTKEKETLPKHVRTLENLSDTDVRHHTLDRLTKEFLGDSASDQDRARMEELASTLNQKNEKTYLYQQLALSVNKTNPKKASEIVSRISDPLARVQTERLLNPTGRPESSTLNDRVIAPIEQPSRVFSSIRGALKFFTDSVFPKSPI